MRKYRITMVAPFPPLIGGMAQLTATLCRGLKKHGHTVLAVDIGRGGLLKLPLLYLRMINAIRKADIVQVLGASGRALWLKNLPAILLGKIFRKVIIFNFVGGGAPDKIDTWNWIHKLPFELADIVVVPTALFKQSLEDRGLRGKYMVIPNVVETDHIKQPFTKKKGHILLAAKGLTSFAGVDLLIQAFQKVQRRIKNAELWIAGEGPERPRLENQVLKNDIHGVSFLGGIPQTEVIHLMNRATLFVHGTKYESFGIALVEAMAAGLPVIAFSVGGIPEVVEHNYTGFLVPYGDVDKFAENTISLLEDQSHCALFGKQAQAWCHRFDWATVSRRWAECYEELVKK